MFASVNSVTVLLDASRAVAPRKLLDERLRLLARVVDAIADSLAAIRPDLEPAMVRTAGPWGHDTVKRVSVL
jgi:hypothetical protein